MKIVNLLSGKGYLEAMRGRSGGIRLGRRLEAITVGEIVRLTEPDFKLTECFGEENKCLVSEFCKLPDPLNKALNAFLQTLDDYTLADMKLSRECFKKIPDAPQRPRGPIL